MMASGSIPAGIFCKTRCVFRSNTPTVLSPLSLANPRLLPGTTAMPCGWPKPATVPAGWLVVVSITTSQPVPVDRHVVVERAANMEWGWHCDCACWPHKSWCGAGGKINVEGNDRQDDKHKDRP